MIHVIAEITIADGTRDSFLECFHAIVPTVLNEPGCIAYAPTLDIETGLGMQERCRPNVVTIVEQWSSIDALKRHLEEPHMEQFRANVADIVLGLSLRVCEPAVESN